MGYSTDFNGEFKLDKPLTQDQKKYLETFRDTRRMKRDSGVAESFSDPIRIAVGLPIGVEGEFFVGNTEDSGQVRDKSVIDYNKPPSTQPSLWCQWVPNEEGTAIVWDESEKFYEYIDWIKYIIENFLKPWGYDVNGEMTWQGEDSDDFGKIIIKHNDVIVKKGKKVY